MLELVYPLRKVRNCDYSEIKLQSSHPLARKVWPEWEVAALHMPMSMIS